MVASLTEQQSALLSHLSFTVVLKNQRIASKGDLSRTQILFLILCSTLDETIVRASYFAKFGISENLTRHYFRQLVKSGYFERVLRGRFIITKKGQDKLNDILTDLDSRLKNGFKWR